MSTQNPRRQDPTLGAALLHETNRALRGHAFYPPKAERAAMPGLYETDSVDAADKTVLLHYFAGACDWYVVEVDWRTGEAFGYVDLGYGGEWGYMSLVELEQVCVRAVPVVVERELDFAPTRFADLRR